MQCPASQPTDLGVGWDREQQQSWNWSLISLPGGAVHSHDLTRVTCLSNEGVEVRKGVPATGNSLGRGMGLESVCCFQGSRIHQMSRVYLTGSNEWTEK